MTGEELYTKYWNIYNNRNKHSAITWAGLVVSQKDIWDELAAEIYGVQVDEMPLAPHVPSTYTPPKKIGDTSWNQFYTIQPDVNDARIIADYQSGMSEDQLLRRYPRLSYDHLKAILPKKV